jgi:hypothetical protein
VLSMVTLFDGDCNDKMNLQIASFIGKDSIAERFGMRVGDFLFPSVSSFEEEERIWGEYQSVAFVQSTCSPNEQGIQKDDQGNRNKVDLMLISALQLIHDTLVAMSTTTRYQQHVRYQHLLWSSKANDAYLRCESQEDY